jgi:hypothetical protein
LELEEIQKYQYHNSRQIRFHKITRERTVFETFISCSQENNTGGENIVGHDGEESYDENKINSTIIFEHLFAKLTIIFCE